jgi:Ribbon-helix-helix protein, copG family
VKRLQIRIDEHLDAALEREALREGTSKVALIRRHVHERIEPLPPLHEDPLWEMVGADEGEGDDSSSVHDFVYGPKE